MDFEHLYNDHFAPLVDLALSKHIAIREAEQLAHDVLLASLRNLPNIKDLGTWLAGSLRCAIATRTGA